MCRLVMSSYTLDNKFPFDIRQFADFLATEAQKQYVCEEIPTESEFSSDGDDVVDGISQFMSETDAGNQTLANAMMESENAGDQTLADAMES